MNIAFDGDGVIFPIEDFQIEEGQKYFKCKEIYDINGYGIKEVFNCNSSQELKFWLKNTFRYNKEVTATAGIPELIRKLRLEGHHVYILTSRAMANKNDLIGSIMRELFEDALKRNQIDVDGIIYCSTSNSEIDKYNAIKKYNISIMIDDKKEIIETIKSVTNAICFETRNNKDYFSDGVLKASNSDELEIIIYDIINRFNKSKTELLDYKEIAKMSDEEKKCYFEGLRQTYYSMRDPFLLEKGENGCKRIVGKMQKVYNFVYKPHVIHSEKFPIESGAILAANHLHSFDPLLIMSSTEGVPFHLLAKKELLDNKLWNYLFTNIGSFFVDNSDAESRRRAKENMIQSVLNGSFAMMFPEGTRNKTDRRLLDFHYGTVSVAQITGKPIYPFGINQDYRPFKNKLVVSIGDPMYVKYNDNLGEKNLELVEKISTLLDEVDEYETEQRLRLKYYNDIYKKC